MKTLLTKHPLVFMVVFKIYSIAAHLEEPKTVQYNIPAAMQLHYAHHWNFTIPVLTKQ